MDDVSSNLLQRFSEVRILFQQRKFEFVPEDFQALVLDLIRHQQFHLGKDLFLAAESTLLREGKDEIHQSLTELELEFSLRFLEASKEFCFRRKYPSVVNYRVDPKQLDTKRIDEDFFEKPDPEVGDTLLDYMDSKLKLFEKMSGTWKPRLIQKMAFLVKEGVKIENLILDKVSICNETEVKTVLLSWFYIAKFYNKFFSPDREEQMDYTKRSIQYYHKVIDYCNLDARAKSLIVDEFRTSVDAADLLERQVRAVEEAKRNEIEDAEQQKNKLENDL